MGVGRWACVGLLLVAFAAASVAAQESEAEFELDVAGSGGRQLLREAEPFDDKRVTCRKSKGKKICIATCYKRICRRSGSKVLCRKAKVSCKKPTVKKATAKKVDDNPKAHGAGHTRKLQSDVDAEVEVLEPETGRQLLREAEPFDDKKVFCRKSKGKKVCRAECKKRVCYRTKKGKKVCSLKKCSCKTGRLVDDNPKKATTAKTSAPTGKVDDKGGKCGGKGCADGPGHTRRLLREAEPYDDKKVFCHKSKGKKVCRTECRKKVCYRSKAKKLLCSMKACSCKTGRVIVPTPKKTATKPRAAYKSPPAFRAGKPPAYKAPPAHDAYDDHGGKGGSGGGGDD